MFSKQAGCKSTALRNIEVGVSGGLLEVEGGCGHVINNQYSTPDKPVTTVE